MKVVSALVMLGAVVWCAPQQQPIIQQAQVWPIRPYEYAYEVADAATNNYQNRVEIKLPNGDVMGSYSYLRPDNIIQTVIYNVTRNLGFQYSISLVPNTRVQQGQQQGQVNLGQQQGQQG